MTMSDFIRDNYSNLNLEELSIAKQLLEKTDFGANVPIIDKNGVSVHKLSIFEEIVLRNLDNLDAVAIETVGGATKMTYRQFFQEVEKYINAYKNMGLKENDVVSLCLPVGIEFICSYYALTTLGVTVNALNVMFLLQDGVKPYLDERCSHTFVCDENYFELLKSKNAFNDENLKDIVICGDAGYNHLFTDSDVVKINGLGNPKANIISFNDFLDLAKNKNKISAIGYDENRISTINYTSGTTAKPKCMGHSDLAPLYLIAEHDLIERDEYRNDRTLLTIPLQHPTGLFYAMVLQMAMGKTLVLEPRYDKTLFHRDIIDYEINHAVQAKPFYSQLVQDRADGKIKRGDFERLRNPYSGGEGIPATNCRQINDTVHFGGCPNDVILGYGRSEEGSSTLVPYNIVGRNNTVGIPLPGNKAKIVDAKTLKDIPQVPGAKGEILVSTPVTPIKHCYLDPYNKEGMSDGSIVDENGERWARAEDIAELVEMPDGSLSFLVLGRASDLTIKNDKEYYLFDLKEQICDIPGVQECEVVNIKNNDVDDFITVHLVLMDDYKDKQDEIVKKVYATIDFIDGVHFYDKFGINATSGKCDRTSMKNEDNGYFTVVDGNVLPVNFERKGNNKVLKKIG